MCLCRTVVTSVFSYLYHQISELKDSSRLLFHSAFTDTEVGPSCQLVDYSLFFIPHNLDGIALDGWSAKYYTRSCVPDKQICTV